MTLSDNIRKIIKIAGKDKAIECCLALPKQLIYFPYHRNNSSDHMKLQRILGKENYERIYSEFQTDYIYFPSSIEDEINKERIRAEYWKNKVPFKELAHKHNRSIDNIRKICRKKPGDLLSDSLEV
jgi:hypothetical protein